MKKILSLLTISLFTINSYCQQGQWTWMNGVSTTGDAGVFGTQGVFAPGNRPPSFYEACEWTDLQGNFWLFGGVHSSVVWGDLWEFKPALNEWAWIKGPGTASPFAVYGTEYVASPLNNPGGRGWGACTWVDTTGNLWLFGGQGNTANASGRLNDLWMYNIASNEWTWMAGTASVNNTGNYGTILVANPLNDPPARNETNGSWTKSGDNTLWMFGGEPNGVSIANDVWKFDISNHEWTWMKGSSTFNQTAFYGTQGVPSPNNDPGQRDVYCKWKDLNGNFWFFGGLTNSQCKRDLWMFNPTTLNWTWMNGDTTFNQTTGISAGQCVTNSTNIPGARYENRVCWTRGCNNFELFTGWDNTGTNHNYDDLWNYNVLCNEWTLMNGNTLFNQTPSYGTIMVSSSTNNPGGRGGAVSWKDTLGNLWMFGGGMNGLGDTKNDMWRFIPDTTCPVLCLGGNATSAFNAIPDSGCSPLTVNFNNNSINGSSYSWNFGDSDTSNLTNPVHTYTDSGTYVVTLIVHASCGGNPDTSTSTITVHLTAATAFIADTLTGCDSLTVHFTNNSTNAISYLWNFGDGNTSIVTNPNHTYTTPGTYTVTLIGFGAGGCNDTAIHQSYITIISPPSVTSAFTALPLSGCNPLTVNFTNNSTNGTSYLWSFGDNTTSTLTNPSHTYTSAGTYTVTLISINTSLCGVVADTSTQFITVNPTAQTSFSADTLNGCAPFTVNFTSFSTNTISYLWHFGDGGTSILPNPTHTYTTSGIYTDTLIAYGAGGCNDTIIHQNYITVITPPIVTSAFIADTLSHCDSVTIHFTNNSTNASTYLWNFGDGNTSSSINPTHTYTTSGNYTVTLIAYDTSPCGLISDTVSHILDILIYQSAIASFPDTTYTACGNLTILFENNSSNAISYLWNFGDGNTSTAANPTHTYSTVGTYTVTLIAYGAGGCNDTVIHQNIIIILNIVNLTSSFTSDTVGCIPFTVSFTNTSSNGTSYLWNFGDGNTSTSFNPSHTYTTTGTFMVTLYTYNSSPCGLLADSSIIHIVVDSSVSPKSSFAAQSIIGCSPVIVTFSNTSSNGTSYLWNFGDGDTSNAKNPTHTFYYGSSGTYTITLITYNNTGKCNNPPDTMTLVDYITVDTCNLYIPNIFSPNGDGKNDFYDVIAEGYTLYHLVIYDRWGLKMFESNDKNILWNGRVFNTGGEAPDGTYYYIFSATDYNSKYYSSHGYLTLIR